MNSLEKAFAQNLKSRRKALGLTQNALAKEINYSEKAISKWESALSFPPVAVLMKLADVLQTTPNDLLNFSEEISYYLGIDGGATKTDFALKDKSGKTIRQLRLASSNPVDIGLEGAKKVLDDGIREICRGIPMRKISVFAGISGGTSGDNRERIREFLSEYHFARFDNGSDAQLIVAAGLKGENGIVVIMGTGSVAFTQRDGELLRTGGFGYLFDYGGNGYSIGRDVISAALMAEDGSGGKTMLSELLSEQTGKSSALSCLSDFYLLKKREIAAFAPLAIQAAKKGDHVALEILRRNMRHISRLLEVSRKKLDNPEKTKVVFVGGLTNHSKLLLPMISEELTSPEVYEFSVYNEPIVEGALMLAGMKREEEK